MAARWLMACVLLSPAVQAATDTKTLVDTVCATCHGADGNGIAEAFPKLAGQRPEYLLKQMNDFVGGKRKNEVMTPFIPVLKGANLKQVAQYFSALPSATAGNANSSHAGKQLYDNGNLANGVPGCLGCHGPGAQGVELNARLAGQYQSYLVAQLKAFKTGTRNNDQAQTMRGAVANLSEAEINAVAEYLATL